MRLERDFYARSVHDVARDLIGCVVRHGETAGRIVETESYHMDEPACHAYAGVTERTSTLFGPPGNAYVYFSYGVHSLLNAVAEEEGVGAAVLIRALEPVDGGPHQPAHDPVGLAERHAAPDEQVGHVGGRDELVRGGLGHALAVELDARQHVRGHPEAELDRVDGVEERLLVLL